jgi:hypothetical protein
VSNREYDESGNRRPAWERFIYGQGCGKTSVLIYDAANRGKQPAPVPMLQVGRGEDADAHQIILTLAPPTVIPLAVDNLPENVQSSPSAMQDNFQMRNRGNFPGELAPLQWPPIEAVIEWGVGGNNARAVVDFVNGATINLTAAFVRVHAVITANAAEVESTSAAYVLSAFIGPGFTTAKVAQKTVYTSVVAAPVDGVAQESGVFSVPRFAKHARLVGLDGTIAPPLTVGTLRFWRQTSGVADGTSNVGNFYVSGNNNAPVEVPNGAMYFSIINGQAGAASYAVVFDLAI